MSGKDSTRMISRQGAEVPPEINQHLIVKLHFSRKQETNKSK